MNLENCTQLEKGIQNLNCTYQQGDYTQGRGHFATIFANEMKPEVVQASKYCGKPWAGHPKNFKEIMITVDRIGKWKPLRMFDVRRMRAMVAHIGGPQSQAWRLLCCHLVSFVEGGRLDAQSKCRLKPSQYNSPYYINLSYDHIQLFWSSWYIVCQCVNSDQAHVCP